MKNKVCKIGFIGCGHMASAIISGYKGEGEIMGSEINEELAKSAQERLNLVSVTTDNKVLAKNSDIIFIATKPNCVAEVLEGIKDCLTKDKLVVSIAAGVKTEKIENIIGEIPVVRVMPNTPALVQCGMCAVAGGKFANAEQVQFVKEFLSAIGKCIELDESQMDIVTAISGSGPAFFYEVINEIAKAGEKLGMDFEKSLLLSAQTALGSAKMIMQSDKTPQELIQSVSTKGGCTEVGVDIMEKSDLAKILHETIEKTAEKARNLG